MYVRICLYAYVYVYIIAYPLLVVPWEGKPSRWFLAGMAHYIYRCYIYKAPHTYTYVRMRMYMPAPAVLCSGSYRYVRTYVSVRPCIFSRQGVRRAMCAGWSARWCATSYLVTDLGT